MVRVGGAAGPTLDPMAAVRSHHSQIRYIFNEESSADPGRAGVRPEAAPGTGCSGVDTVPMPAARASQTSIRDKS
ncbi:hypothetical protein AMJ71_04865 [candidate division TA06 bacterium SM1_40]|uniref:Uncharacterized protein n=2 Tax=Bacteria division TA06 TaxID=1156500 RepID=A0A0S8JJK7_UNCT6|nr:MAG: hypothetical protein AMJ82_05350 [candidate division TA06 bacterium SM23_40]KPL09977.1 MAG: hypothetical protein AMJ71_04865 [candidate division TA06 bacterium SM1_40]